MAVYDVGIIGGGVVGVSILYELALRGYSCVLLEKNKDLASGASSGNSGMIHSGFDAAPGTLEFNFILKSKARMKSFLERHSIPYRNIGAIMIAHNEDELKKIQSLHESVRRSSVTETKLLTKAEVHNLEPHLTDSIIGGLLVPQEAVTDSCLYVITMAHQAIKQGAQVFVNHEVVSLQPMSHAWQITTSQKPVQSRLVINAAGLYGDRVNHMGLGTSQFSIKPRQGDFIVLGKEASHLIHHSILPIPTTKTKGVIIFPSVYGNLVIGPTAEETTERENPRTSLESAKSLKQYGEKIVPDLSRYQTFETYAGLRPATEFKDYQLTTDPKRQWITVGGIRSTGLTASMGIAGHIADTIEKDFQSITPSKAGQATESLPPHWQTDQMMNYKLDDREYSITHKLMRIGQTKAASKL